MAAMLKLLERPKRVLLTESTTCWPEEAMAVLHSGFYVHICRDWTHVFARWQQPIVKYTAEAGLVDIPIEKIAVRLEKLAGMTHEIPFDFPLLPELLRIAAEMNHLLGKDDPERVLIREGSYKWNTQNIFYPEWGWRSSIRFWLTALFGKKIRWHKMPGVLKQQGRATIIAGVLPYERIDELEAK